MQSGKNQTEELTISQTKYDAKCVLMAVEDKNKLLEFLLDFK